jgi:hypothetical protein
VEIPIHPAFIEEEFLNFDSQSSDQEADQVSDQDKKSLNAHIIKEIQALNENVKEQESASSDQVSDQDKKQINTDYELLLAHIKKVLELGKPDEKLIAKYKVSAIAISNEQLAILKYANTPQSNKDIQENALGLKTHTDNFKNHIEPLLNSGFIRRTIPNKPTSKLQKYYSTERGRIVIYIREELLKN